MLRSSKINCFSARPRTRTIDFRSDLHLGLRPGGAAAPYFIVGPLSAYDWIAHIFKADFIHGPASELPSIDHFEILRKPKFAGHERRFSYLYYPIA